MCIIDRYPLGNQITELSWRIYFIFIYIYIYFFPRAHCARDSAHVVANPIQPDPSNTSSINQTGNLLSY